MIPLLTLALLFPLVAAMLIRLPRLPDRWALALAQGLALIELGLTVRVYQRYQPEGPALAESLPFIPFHPEADGLTVLFLLLTALITVLALLHYRILSVAGHRADDHPTRFLATVLALEAVMQGLWLTRNLLWFVVLSGLEWWLVSALLKCAPSPGKALAIRRYRQFLGVSWLLLASGTLLLGWSYAGNHGGRWSFDLADLMLARVDGRLHSLLFFLLFYGFAIRVPLFPLHGWLPVVAEQGALTVAPVFLLGLKAGVYGLLRFVLPLLPETVLSWHRYVVAFAVIGIFYSALLALLQSNLRRLLAYAVVSHSSVLIVGLFSLGQAAFQSAVMLSVNFGLAITGLFFMSDLVLRRTGTLILADLGGLFDRLRVIALAFLVAGLSIIGMPGTPGFDAVHLMLEASIVRFGGLLTIVAAIGNVAAAGFLLRAFQKAFLAPVTAEHRPDVERATPREWLLAVLMIVLLLGVGFYSEPWINLTARTLEGMSGHYPHP
ncbi:MAG: proton-conducting transporter membrane subunit [Pseudomonadota bacterium]